MTPFQRLVRARVYTLLAAGARRVDATALASHTGWDHVAIAEALQSLHDDHRLLVDPRGRVLMAHPFSGVPTGYTAHIGNDHWFANCAWDGLAILALLGDGVARCPDGLEWSVADGEVTAEGLVHLLVPAARFWDDVEFT